LQSMRGESHSKRCPRRLECKFMVLRKVCWLMPLLFLASNPSVARDFLPGDHGLRYVGRDGVRPVTVEVTFRTLLEGECEYVEWMMPRGWASWFGRPQRTLSRLRFRDDLLVLLGVDSGAGLLAPPSDLAAGALDALGVRLRARADIARGLRQAEYAVWRGGEAHETWILEVTGEETIETPDGPYQALKFRLGSKSEWIEGWSAPLLIFHFVKLVHWHDGKKISELRLDDKQL
jgi:hypothetical protein